MEARKARIRVGRYSLAIPVTLLTLVVSHGGIGAGAETGAAGAASPCALPLEETSILCPALPDAPPTYVSPTATPPERYHHFAWKSFVALNWPAVSPGEETGYARGFPDLDTSFSAAAPDSLGVWETWKEKRELFSPEATPPLPDWRSPIDYRNVRQGIEPCRLPLHAAQTAPAERVAEALASGTVRFILQPAKTAFPADSLDETVQVFSEARFPDVPGDDIRGKAVEGQVFAASRPLASRLVRYEVKLNYEYFEYVSSTRMYVDAVRQKFQDRSGDHDVARLPFEQRRLKVVSFPRRKLSPARYDPATFDPAKSYSAQYCADFYRRTPPYPGHPCLTGTVQTKAAWLQVPEGERQKFVKDFHVADALYYRLEDGKVCMDRDHFALLGLHIIQKTANQGFYVYATWEHAGLEEKGFHYRNYYPGDNGFHPLDGSLIEVRRYHPILPLVKRVTAEYHDRIRNANPDSVWLNYDLVGTQFFPVDADKGCAEDPERHSCNESGIAGQPFYLANLVVETNWGLQNFQGVPPGEQIPGGPLPAYDPTEFYRKSYVGGGFYLPNDTQQFARTLPNVGYGRANPQGNLFTMGGCMGCHGIAQANGTDFSFVLLRGQKGADADTLKKFFGQPD